VGRAWIDALPGLVDECAAAWDLSPGAPYPGSNVSLVLPVRRTDGSGAVLKIQYPHRESAGEAAALARWDGNGAVCLLAHDPGRNALLIERCEPGTHLSAASPETAMEVISDLLPRLWRPPGAGFTSLADEAARWARNLPVAWESAGRPFERRLVDAALEYLETLPGSQGPPVLLHQDLHAENVLCSRREPWLAIDPKPLSGEREFGIAPTVRSSELGHGRDVVLRRFDRLTGQLGLDRERSRGWTIAQTLAWSIEGGRALPEHLQVARWLLGDD
jgi:streptomycin 6-kinase